MTILTGEFAKELNGLHASANVSAKRAVSEALTIGEKLLIAKKSSNDVELRNFMDDKLEFSRSVAYRYMELYTYRDQIGESENIFNAYKAIASVKKDQKQIEYQKSADRIREYKETGVKPEGYKKNTDERRAQKAVQNPSWENVPGENIRIDYTRLNAPELLQELGDNAQKWAQAFIQIVVEQGKTIDEGLMIGWFANAIETAKMTV